MRPAARLLSSVHVEIQGLGPCRACAGSHSARERIACCSKGFVVGWRDRFGIVALVYETRLTRYTYGRLVEEARGSGNDGSSIKRQNQAK